MWKNIKKKQIKNDIATDREISISFFFMFNKFEIPVHSTLNVRKN